MAPRCTDALDALSAALRERGLTRLYCTAYNGLGCLSVAPGLTVWCYGKVLTWTVGDQETRLPAADTPNAARQIGNVLSLNP